MNHLDAIVESVEEAVGMGHNAWDAVDPREIVKAVLNYRQQIQAGENHMAIKATHGAGTDYEIDGIKRHISIYKLNNGEFAIFIKTFFEDGPLETKFRLKPESMQIFTDCCIEIMHNQDKYAMPKEDGLGEINES